MSAAYTGEIPENEWPRLLTRAEPKPVHALEYSNLGYNVAAMAIDAVRPKGWKRYLETAIYRPAGLAIVDDPAGTPIVHRVLGKSRMAFVTSAS